jgi:hypothetical protein
MFCTKLAKKLYRVERVIGSSARIDKFLSGNNPVFRGKRKSGVYQSAADILDGVGEIGVGTIESLYQLSPQLISPLAIMVGDPVAPMHGARVNYDVFHRLPSASTQIEAAPLLNPHNNTGYRLF